MALTLTLTAVDGAIANRATRYTITIASDSASPVDLESLQITELGTRAATIQQPQFLTPQAAAGEGQPTIAAAGSVSYGFTVVWNVPRTSGPSPQSATGSLGPAGMMVGQPALPSYILEARAETSDDSTGLATLTVPVLSAVPIFPRPEGGATVFTQGNNANLIAALF